MDREVEDVLALAAALPRARKETLPGRDHLAHLRAPGEVARVIADLADAVLGPGPGCVD